ncbi:hypothetical protein BAE44_0010561 [Dichanthelium oligosanthes]|uniref:Uncharacterized protein n=1 Tax=Dichanthelium oligosanthes TaxID=888268 RepID=A0A1E5VTJ1_9POAL|nr:hypothetical protein BAE44_0010561 [Dichanthelium oligosanthes]
MLPMRNTAASPCSLAALLLRRLSSYSSSSVYSVRRHASSSFSSQAAAASTAWFVPLCSSPRTRGFSAWASASGPAGPAESPATKALEAKIKEQLEADAVTVIDTSGDCRHVWLVPTNSPTAAACYSFYRFCKFRWTWTMQNAVSVSLSVCLGYANDILDKDLGDISFWVCSSSPPKTKHCISLCFEFACGMQFILLWTNQFALPLTVGGPYAYHSISCAHQQWPSIT